MLIRCGEQIRPHDLFFSAFVVYSSPCHLHIIQRRRNEHVPTDSSPETNLTEVDEFSETDEERAEKRFLFLQSNYVGTQKQGKCSLV